MINFSSCAACGQVVLSLQMLRPDLLHWLSHKNTVSACYLQRTRSSNCHVCHERFWPDSGIKSQNTLVGGFIKQQPVLLFSVVSYLNTVIWIQPEHLGTWNRLFNGYNLQQRPRLSAVNHQIDRKWKVERRKIRQGRKKSKNKTIKNRKWRVTVKKGERERRRRGVGWHWSAALYTFCFYI